MTVHMALVAGGTGGHVMPAWASAEALQETDHTFFWVTDPRGEAFFKTLPSLDKQGACEILPALAPFGWGRGSIVWLYGFYQQLVRSFLILRKQHPHIVVGFGGYPSLAVGIAALCLGIPLWIHEQNAVLGRTNRLLSVWAKKVLLTFPQTHHVLFPPRTVVLGTPVRQEVCRVAEKTLAAPPPFVLLVLGGSQGAHIFGELIPQAIGLLSPSVRADMHIIQQCRPQQVETLKKVYHTLGIQYDVASFFPEAIHHMACAHALISRAGASTLSEWMVFGKPALFIPYPAALDDHQAANASWVTSHEPLGPIQMQQESNLTPQALADILKAWIYAAPSWKPTHTCASSCWMTPPQTRILWRQLIAESAAL